MREHRAENHHAQRHFFRKRRSFCGARAQKSAGGNKSSGKKSAAAQDSKLMKIPLEVGNTYIRRVCGLRRRRLDEDEFALLEALAAARAAELI